MKITIDIKSGQVSITSDTALSLQQDFRDRQHDNVENLVGMLIAAGGCEDESEKKEVQETETAVAGTEASVAETVANPVPSRDDCAALDVVNALNAMIEAKPQWPSRSLAAIVEHFDGKFTPESIEAALIRAVDIDAIHSRMRRTGEFVFSVNE